MSTCKKFVPGHNGYWHYCGDCDAVHPDYVDPDIEAEQLRAEVERLRALLGEARQFVYEHGHYVLGNKESLLLYPRIDAALAEGKG